MFNLKNGNICNQLLRREYGLSSSLNHHSVVEKNISQGNRSKTIFNKHSKRIITFDIKDHFVATAGDDGKVILWNLETRKIVWIRDYDLSNCLAFGIFKIGGNCLILSSVMIDKGRSIKIVDLEQGIETTTIKIPNLDLRKICVLGERIFTTIAEFDSDGHLIGENALREWSLQGEIVRTIEYRKPSGIFPLFFGSSDFVVDILDYRKIYIHQLQKNATVELAPLSYGIKCAHINQKRLFCGTRPESGDPHVVIIDMETNSHTLLNFSMSLGAGLTERINNRVTSILFHNDAVYLGFEEGKVGVCFLKTRSFHTFGMHSSQIDSLALKGNLLMSASPGNFNNNRQVNKPGEVNFWDVRSLKKVGVGLTCNTPFLLNVCFSDHRVLARNQGSLIVWDYLVAHQGEQFTEESPTTITATTQECVIQ